MTDGEELVAQARALIGEFVKQADERFMWPAEGALVELIVHRTMDDVRAERPPAARHLFEWGVATDARDAREISQTEHETLACDAETRLLRRPVFSLAFTPDGDTWQLFHYLYLPFKDRNRGQGLWFEIRRVNGRLELETVDLLLMS